MGGAFLFLHFVTLQNNNNNKGNLFRIISIRIYTIIQILYDLCIYELFIFKKIQRVGNSIMKFLFVLDRKHRIYDKIMVFNKWIYWNFILPIWNTISKSQQQQQQQQQPQQEILLDENREESNRINQERRRYNN